ncbi:MAG: hypothetical protein LBD94_00555 [Rickettsiales bacterium]|jgi:hypothetical protein|nr:hypothetical protein [Rickettsiales bacterium]
MEKDLVIIKAAGDLFSQQKAGSLAKFHTYNEAFHAINMWNPDAKISTMCGKCCMNSPRRGVFAVKRAIADLIDPDYLNEDLSPKCGYKELQVKHVLDKFIEDGLGGTFLYVSDLHAMVAKHVKISEDSFRFMLCESDKSHFSRIVSDAVKKLMKEGYFDMSPGDKVKNKTNARMTDAVQSFISGDISLDSTNEFHRHAEFVKKFAEQVGVKVKFARKKCRSPLIEAAMKQIIGGKMI